MSSFFSNNFVEHPMGSHGLYGVNFFGCNSIIQFDGDIWKFMYFKHGSDVPYYVNKDGQIRQIDLVKIRHETPERITRMMVDES